MPLRRMARGLHPGTQSGDHGLFNKCRWRFTPVFPRKIVVPVAPPRITRAFRTLFARQAKIADGNETPRRPLGGPVAIGESVKLFDITERMTSLPLDPIPQPGLEGAVIQFKGARWQCGAIADGHDPRLAIGNGRQHRDEIDCQAGRDERRRSILHRHRLISFANSRNPADFIRVIGFVPSLPAKTRILHRDGDTLATASPWLRYYSAPAQNRHVAVEVESESWRVLAYGVGKIARCQMAVVLLDHARIGVAEVARNNHQRHSGHDR